MTRSMVAQSQYYRATRLSDYSFGRATRVKDRRVWISLDVCECGAEDDALDDT